jgi:hypothetical protein
LTAAWPDQGNELLLRAALREPAEATRCWEEWKSRNSLDEAAWEDHKLLAVVASRLHQIDPGFHDTRRLQGLVKALWTTAQIKKKASLSGLDILIAAEIPVLLLKGPAFDLAAPRRDRRRLSGDLDILVRRCDLRPALGLLAANGWRNRAFPLASQLRYLRTRPGINLTNDYGGDIDIHHQPMHLRWMPDRTLAELWRRARSATFGEREILIPSDADLLCISASHGLRRTRQVCYGAWALDFHHIFTEAHARLQCLPQVAHELGAALHVLSALLFVQRALGTPVETDLIAALKHRSKGLGARLRYHVGTPARNERDRRKRRRLQKLMEARVALLSYCSEPIFSIRHLHGKDNEARNCAIQA